MTTILPGVQGNETMRTQVREEWAKKAEIKEEKSKQYAAQRNAKKELNAEVKEILTAIKPLTFEYPGHTWIEFSKSKQRELLVKMREEAIQSGKVSVNQVSGSAVRTREPENWAQSLKDHVLDLLVPAFSDIPNFDREGLSKMYDAKAGVWRAAFTSAAYNPNSGKNYELLEKIGDSSGKLGLQMELISYRPRISEHELTVAINTILAKTEQSRISEKLRLPEFLLSPYPEVNVHEQEDLFESFLGALYFMGEVENSAQDMVMRFIWHLINEDEIKAVGVTFDTPPKTQVLNLFKRLGWGQPVEQTAREGDHWRTRIIFHESFSANKMRKDIYILDMNDARNHIEKGKPYPKIDEKQLEILHRSGEVGNDVGKTSDISVYNAYANALKKLKNIGLIREASLQEHYRENQDFDRIYEESYARAYERAKSEGYDNIFSTDNKIRYDTQKRNAYITLIGIRGEKLETIYMITIPVNPKNRQLLDDRRELRRVIYESYAADRDVTRPFQEVSEETYEESSDEEEE